MIAYAPADADSSAFGSDRTNENAPMSARDESFPAYTKRVCASVETVMDAWMGERLRLTASLHSDVALVVEAMRELAMRGGKRFRAVLVAASYEACGGEGGQEAVVWAGVCMETLQTYLLIHDDWMDGDELRRGGPSVHAALRHRLGGVAQGDIAAILAGDFASALSLEALTRVPTSPERAAAAMKEFARMQCDVVLGQILDVRGVARSPKEVETMHALKTASYTVRGPLLLGAALAGADEARHAALEGASGPLGIAFQLRDDLLGAFGDPARTGKPRGGDLRAGKHNALVVEALTSPATKARVVAVLGKHDATDAEIDSALEAIIESGARSRVESRLDALLSEARSTLMKAPLVEHGRRLLIDAVDALGVREA